MRLPAFVIAGGMLVTAFSCAHPRPATHAATESDPASVDALMSVNAIPWSQVKRLTWGDYRGVPQITSDASALTGYLLTYESECNGDAFDFRVETLFLPEQSWVKTGILLRGRGSDQLLRHEQLHFDLSEVHARMMRRALEESSDPCRKTPEERYAIVEPFLRADRDGQREYDRDTVFGSNTVRQAAWEDDIQRRLKSLNAWGGRR